MNEKLTASSNPLIKRIKTLSGARGRRDAGAFLVEGEVMIREALSSALTPRWALSEEECALTDDLRALGADVRLCTRGVLEAACDTKTPQGVCAVFSLPAAAALSGDAPLLLALDGVQDPGNLGTILRTADAAGFCGALLSPLCADVYAPKVQRAAMGSTFRVPTQRCALPEALASLKTRGCRIIVSALDGLNLDARPVCAPNDRLVLVIGSEAHGVSGEVMRLADVMVKIPMRGRAESLNAAVAAGILMYELTRPR